MVSPALVDRHVGSVLSACGSWPTVDIVAEPILFQAFNPTPERTCSPSQPFESPFEVAALLQADAIVSEEGSQSWTSAATFKRQVKSDAV